MKKVYLIFACLCGLTTMGSAQQSVSQQLDDTAVYVLSKVSTDLIRNGHKQLSIPTVGVHSNMDSALRIAERKLQEQLKLSDFEFHSLFFQREFHAVLQSDGNRKWYVGVGAYRP